MSTAHGNSTWLQRLTADHGMALVLLLLCVLFSALTYKQQHPSGQAAGREVAAAILRDRNQQPTRVLIVAQETRDDQQFAAVLQQQLRDGGAQVVAAVEGPAATRAAFDQLVAAGDGLDVIACTRFVSAWLLFEDLDTDYPALAGVRMMVPQSYGWPDFLKADNLLNITNQIAVIAIVAVGMTLVIVSGGIDLSVGSLIALSAVTTCLLIRNVAGAQNASVAGMVLASLAGIALCGAVGLANGAVITLFRVPPFIVTLAMMLMASGTAFMLTGGQSVYEVPQSYTWLGRGTMLWRFPNAAVLMLVIYVAAHVLTTRTALGRYLYAVGGNPQAARLSGVPVRSVLLFAYAASGALAGLGGVVMASQLKSGAPDYGQMYELYTIAAAVVGGASLSGGYGKVFGSLIGALIIAVIRNGMNLMNVESYTQDVILGGVILAAVLADQIKRRK